MKKLIELLNEFHFFDTEYIGYYLDKEENRIYFKTEVVDKGITNEERISDEWLISKKLGFIKRLVENDKIDLKKYVREMEKSGTYSKKYGNIKYMLLMLLAIQDNPIEFLVSILK